MTPRAGHYDRVVSSRRRVLITALCGLLCLAATAACGGSYTVALPEPDARVAGYCAALDGELPGEVSGVPRRDPEPASELTAGWGQSVVLRCGVPEPAEDADEDTDGLEMAGVSWSFARQADGSARVTTTLRKAYVEVTLKGKYAYDSGPLFDLAPAIKSAVPDGI